MEIVKIETNNNKGLYFNRSNIIPRTYTPKMENEIVNIYPNIEFQEFLGFGGAITEAAAYSYSLLSDEKKKDFMNDMFGEIGYSLCRLTIGSCDFALDSYSYVKKNDLSDFSIERDFKYIIPFIKDALNINPNLKFLASPWSPPKFMKNNKMLILGGKLSDKYKETYANYLSKYILAYKDAGINIDYITVQNEPNATQIWESCLYSPEEESNFVSNFLYPTFKWNNIETKILIYDHNKEKLLSRAIEEFKNNNTFNATSGIAFHWYTGDHFENIELCRKLFPDKLLIHTEGCVGYDTVFDGENLYGYDICGDLNAGINGYIDWNILLNNKRSDQTIRKTIVTVLLC